MNALSKALALMLFSWAALTACDNASQQQAPAMDMPAEKHARTSVAVEAVLSRFIEASIRRQHGDYYELLSARDQAVKSREKYLEEQGQQQPNLADKYFDKIVYRIESVDLQDKQAEATVSYQFPDVERMIKQVYNLAILGDKALPPLDEMKQALDREYLNRPLPMKSRTRHFTLFNEQGQWRVYLGWDKTPAQ